MYDIIIIGAGISGQTAAIYASRKKMNYLFITKEIGGQFLESGEVVNYPGIIKTTGEEFASVMEEQLEFNDVSVNENEEVKSIEKKEKGFKVTTDKNSYESYTVLIATGARHRMLKVPGEERLKNKGVTYCAVCDGPLFSGKNIAIIGGGDSALEAADFTKSIANKIYLINRNKDFSAHEYLVERVKSMDNLEIIEESNTVEILGEEMVKGLVYEKNGEKKELDVNGIIIEIGRVPNTNFVKGLVELDKHGHIIIDCQTGTSVEGIFAAGDCASGHEYQYCIAAGQGCMALLKAARYIAKRNL